jgi:hypothetical protein
MDNNLVNGPINAFRLEGNINNIKKIIYLFGDRHMPLGEETKCDSFTSKDFISFFYETIKISDQNLKFDFFYENFADVDMFDVRKYSSHRREMYIREIRKFVDSDMDIEKTNNKKEIFYKNKGSKTFKNLRLHYLDIRSFYGCAEFYKIEDNIFDLLKSFELGSNDLKYQNWIIDRLLVILMEMKFLTQYMMIHINKMAYNKEKKFKDKFKKKIFNKNINLHDSIYDMTNFEKRMMKYSKKIFGRYNNDSVKKNLLDSDIIPSILDNMGESNRKINGCLNKLLKLKDLLVFSDFELNKDHRENFNYGPDFLLIKKIFYQIKIKFFIITDLKNKFFYLLTDLYLLRRILDKNYIDHGIVYTGSDHTLNYVYTLVKNFGFKITHANYLKLSLDETNKIIFKKNLDQMHEFLMNPIFKQCVDMDKFPKNFE